MGGEASEGGDLNAEAALIDTHVHLWDSDDPAAAWLRDEPELPQLVSSADFRAAADPHVRGVVLVEAVGSEHATRELIAAAATLPWPTRVIGWLDVTTDELSHQLDRLVDGDGSGALAGIRLTLDRAASADSGLDLVDRALAALAARGLVAELLLDHERLRVAAGLAARHPSLPVVVDHLGGLAGAPSLDEWERAIAALAAQPNTVLKLSGCAGIASATFARSARHAAAQFGPERLMFGSDWPLSNRYGSHAATVAASRAPFLDRTAAWTAEVFAGTAARVYGLTAALRGGKEES